MEKIYEEQIGGQKSPRQKINFSIVLSFFVAAFAIVSLIAVGFNQISFAAPIAGNNDITFYYPQGTLDYYRLGAFVSEDAIVSGGIFNVPLYQADSTTFNDSTAIPLFCIEHHAAVSTDAGGEAYTRGELVADIGLAYILNQSATLGGVGIVPKGVYTDEQYAFVERYATQVAIWRYLHDTQYLAGEHNDRYSLANEDDSATNYQANETLIEQAAYLRRLDDVSADDIALSHPTGSTFYDSYILPVINAAKSSPTIKTITINGDSTISKVGDDDFYQTEALSVSCSSNDMENFTVTVSGIDGAFVVDKDYNTVENGFFADPSASFYVRIPVQSVSETAKTIRIDVHAVVNNYLVGSVYYATASDHQKVVAIISDQADLPAIKEIPVVGSPDTGMNKAQTIYFIGLIVLLCGVGIIYANAKPVETE